MNIYQNKIEDYHEIKKCLDILSNELILMKTSISFLETIIENINDKNIKKFQNFFIFIILNLSTNIILQIIKFFDKRKDSYSFYWIKDKQNYPEKCFEEIFKEIEETEDKIKPIKEIRNKIIAHLDISKNKSMIEIFNEDIFKDITETKNQLNEISNKIENFINKIREFYYPKTLALEYSKTNIGLEFVRKDYTIDTINHGEILYVKDELVKLIKNLSDNAIND